MLSKNELIRNNINVLLNKETRYDFPDFLTALRKCYSMTRVSATREMKLSGSIKLYRYENGFFNKPIPMTDLQKIADYYEIDSALLKMKMDEFLSDGKGVAYSRHYATQNAQCKTINFPRPV